MENKRPSKTEYYLGIAKGVSKRATCLRRRYGAVIVNNDIIVGTGYCGAPRERDNCIELGVCKRESLNVPSGERYELCRSVHAEMNAIINAGRDRCMGGTIYIYGEDVKTDEKCNSEPCLLCKRVIINSGLEEIITPDSKTSVDIIEC